MSIRSFSIFFIVILTVFLYILRIYRIGEPSRYYFDEVYHAVTAKAYADNNPAAYNPFAPAPKEGTAYEWLHPPLAKLAQAGSIKIFGDTPLGWRVPSLIFGTAIIPATFTLAFVLFGPMAAIFASLTIAFENLTYVMSRITMNDVFITFFSVCSFIFAALYTKERKFKFLILTSAFLGFAVASKWSGIYAIVAVFGYLVMMTIKAKRISLRLLLLLIIPSFIYIGAYGQFWVQGHTLSDFINLHKQIWWYQNRHDLEHSYGTTALYCVPKGLNGPKTWCPWILDIRGVYFSYEQYGEKAGYIYALGNPLIFWVGIIAVSYLLGKFIDERKKEYGFILIGYFVFWVPWIFSPRLMFLYHYLPALPFLAIALGIALAEIYKSRFKILAFVIVLIFIATFFYLYPISSGWPINPAAIDRFMWLKTWR